MVWCECPPGAQAFPPARRPTLTVVRRPSPHTHGYYTVKDHQQVLVVAGQPCRKYLVSVVGATPANMEPLSPDWFFHQSRVLLQRGRACPSAGMGTATIHLPGGPSTGRSRVKPLDVASRQWMICSRNFRLRSNTAIEIMGLNSLANLSLPGEFPIIFV